MLEVVDLDARASAPCAGEDVVELSESDLAAMEKLSTAIALYADGQALWRNAAARAAGDPPCCVVSRPARRSATGEIGALQEWPAATKGVAHGLRALFADERIITLLGALPAVITVQDANDVLVFANSAATTVLGAPRDALIGRRKLDVVPVAFRETVRSSDHQAWNRGEMVTTSQNDYTRGFRFLTYKHVIEDVDCERLLISNSLDVTELERAREDLAALSSVLESQVRTRTAELEATLSEAKAADRAKSEFLATMSHELRTPLNAILGFGQMLSNGVTPAKSSEYGGLVARAGGHLSAVIQDILDYTQVEAGRLALRHAPFSPAATLREVAQLVGPDAMVKGLCLETRCDAAADIEVMGDAGRVRQVLLNLASNAVKFTDYGGVEMRCAVTRKSAGAIHVDFAVADTGRGVPGDVGDQIFEPFNDVSDRLAKATPGTGLGLAISRRLAEMMGGAIAYDSTLGEGSVFRFTLNGDAC